MGQLQNGLVWVFVLCVFTKIFWVTAEPCNLLTSQQKANCFNGALAATDDVTWFQTCVVEYFCLQPQPGQDPEKFKKPQFEEEIKASPKDYPSDYFKYFEYAAKRIEKFFLSNRDWKTTKSNQDYRANNCVKLLAITEARYLYVTYVLFIQSDKNLTACKNDTIGRYFLPESGVCFPRPYGSATCTSDYDVGLIGHNSGILTSAFNEYFREKFNKPSEEVFDTNVYAYTLEYAMPELFIGMVGFFKNIVPYLDLKPWYQMQELANAYFKMYKFRDSFYKEFKDYAQKNLGGLGTFKSVPDRNQFFTRFIKKLERLDENKKAVKNIDDLRSEHNKIYEEKVEEAKKHFDNRESYEKIASYMSEMSVALVYAAEAYHTRGAMRHVVGDLQMHQPIVKETTTVMDYWASMIENWADSNKEYDHCPELKVNTKAACLLKMSKYLSRTFNAMKNIYKILSRTPYPANGLRAAKLVVQYYSQADPEAITLDWVSKYRGKQDEIPDFNKNIKPFLDSVGCRSQKEESALDFDCMKSIQAKVMEYNNILVSATAKESQGFQDIFILMPNGQKKTAPV